MEWVKKNAILVWIIILFMMTAVVMLFSRTKELSELQKETVLIECDTLIIKTRCDDKK